MTTSKWNFFPNPSFSKVSFSIYSVMNSSVQSRVVLWGVKDRLAPVDIALLTHFTKTKSCCRTGCLWIEYSNAVAMQAILILPVFNIVFFFHFSFISAHSLYPAWALWILGTCNSHGNSNSIARLCVIFATKAAPLSLFMHCGTPKRGITSFAVSLDYIECFHDW